MPNSNLQWPYQSPKHAKQHTLLRILARQK